MDEIDSLLCQRSEGENEASRRMKTEFLVQFDGCGTMEEDRVLLIGATNRPSEIDEAARRRFRKKLYIPLPEDNARRALVQNLLLSQSNSLTMEDINDIVAKTEGYSGSDIDGLVREAAMGPVRVENIGYIDSASIRPITQQDFINALGQVKKSVTEDDLNFYLKFDQEFGSRNLC